VEIKSKRFKSQNEDKNDSDSDNSDDDDNTSVLSEISNESVYFESKVGYQKRALLRKNLSL
jgi:hypothetical protein